MGGKAFEGITRRVSKYEVLNTVQWLQKKWIGSKIQGGDFRDHLLGSAGKNDTSGDIDLNLNIELYDQAGVAEELKKLLGEDKVKPRPGNNQIFTAVPIEGDPKNGYVQVDFMFGDYVWQKFSYHSPKLDTTITPSRYGYHQKDDVSCVKGLYRTELLKALIAYNSDWVLEENGEMIARVGPTFFHDKGCVWRYRHRPMRKDGKGRVQEFKELTKEEFLKIYPSALTASRTVIKTPDEFMSFVFGDQRRSYLTIDSVNSLEGIVSSLYYCTSRSELDKIYEIYLERLNSLKVEIPKTVFKKLGIKV